MRGIRRKIEAKGTVPSAPAQKLAGAWVDGDPMDYAGRQYDDRIGGVWPLDYVDIAPDLPEPAADLFAAGPMFTLTERILLGALTLAAVTGLWAGWPA